MRIALMFLLSLALCGPAASSVDSANELLSACEGLLSSSRLEGTNISIPTADYMANQCWGYIRAFQDLSYIEVAGDKSTVTHACPAEGSSELQWVRVFVAYAQKHPERLHESGASMAFDAFRSAFRCPKQN